MSADNTNSGGGLLFGLTVPPGLDGIYFVGDADNTFACWLSHGKLK